MVSLQVLPNEEQLERIEKKYPQMDRNSVMSFLTLLRVSTDLSSAFDKLLTKHGLLQNRWLILAILVRDEDNSVSPSELSKALGVSAATLSRLLEGLESDGFVKRTQNQVDRRAHEIALTAKGIKIINKVMPEYLERVSQVFKKVSASQHQDLMEVLSAIVPEKLHDS